MEIVKRIKSPNFISLAEPRKINYIIIHFTEVELTKAIDLLTTKKGGVSCHYLINKNGDIDQLVDEKNIALHAGRSSWKNDHEINDTSIGIEIDNSGSEKFTQSQMNSVIGICKELSSKYNIPRENILGHSDIAPSRKIDPGIYFDWKLLLEDNLGMAFSKPTDVSSNIMHNFGYVGNQIAKLQTKLSKLGYRIYVTGVFDQQTNEVVRAFQSHFCPEVILEKGGIEFYNNPDSIFVWDEYSEEVLATITTPNNYSE